jgi:uncharacterized membrane protein YgdD (TMEM256/DUF423 family)
MNYARLACISLALAVVLGSMGAHAMKPILTEEALNSWDTAVKYQYYQSLGLLILDVCGRLVSVNMRLHNFAKHAIAAGILCFSASLYLRSSSPLTGVDFSWLGPVAPIGGLLFIAGWILAAFAFTNGNKVRVE